MISSDSVNIDQISELIFKMADEAMLSNEVPVAGIICRMDMDADPGGSVNILNSIEAFIKGEDISGLKITGRGANQIVNDRDPTSHGEILCIRDACTNQNSERLSNSFLITTLEPCIMCAGAIILARLEAVIYFAPTLSGIGMKTLLSQNPEQTHAFNHYPKLYHLKEYENRASEMLRSFFRLKRSS